MVRIAVDKTFKLFVNGQFIRSESGRYFQVSGVEDERPVNLSQASKKDLNASVGAARKALTGWRGKTALNRSQILYRIAEILEARRQEVLESMMNLRKTEAETLRGELNLAIDQVVWYAGWVDKYAPLVSTVNPVSGPFLSFSWVEPMGVVGVVAPEDSMLSGLLTVILVSLVPGNTCVVLSSRKFAPVAVTVSEVLATSDVPAGVVNVLTGDRKELLPHFYAHMDINAVLHPDRPFEVSKEELEGWLDPKGYNLKRFPELGPAIVQKDWAKTSFGPLDLVKLSEIKTVWRPCAMT